MEDMVFSETVASEAIDKYIAAHSPPVRRVLTKIRVTIRKAAPLARETTKDRMPAFEINGVVIYFAAFKGYIGLYPPVREDAALMRAVSRYAGLNRGLRFPLDRPVPYHLIAWIARHRAKLNLDKFNGTGGAKRRKARSDRNRYADDRL
jgi:uncharacterized protein YdhG (YjbR/CyaY superfamily)